MFVSLYYFALLYYFKSLKITGTVPLPPATVYASSLIHQFPPTVQPASNLLCLPGIRHMIPNNNFSKILRYYISRRRNQRWGSKLWVGAEVKAGMLRSALEHCMLKSNIKGSKSIFMSGIFLSIGFCSYFYFFAQINKDHEVYKVCK